MQFQQRHLYLLVLGLITVVVLTALGGGLFNQQVPWQLQWQHQMFSDLCHQIVDRSFWINNQPMAVCSRCIGIYVGFAFGWILLPVAAMGNLTSNWSMKKGALVAVLLNFLDIIGNILSLWENTLVSRLVVGSAIGITAALIFSGDFFKIIFK